MYNLTVYNKTLITPDPPITTVPGSLAAGNREWNPAGSWPANFGGDSTHPSWAYMDNRGPRSGFNDLRTYWWSVHHNIIAATTPGAKGYIGFHSDPSQYAAPDLDTRNFIGYETKYVGGGSYELRVVAWDSLGQKSTSVAALTTTAGLYRMMVQYVPSTRTVHLSRCDPTSHAILDFTTLTLPADRVYENMTMLASRDDPDSSYAINLTGSISEIQIEWRDITDDWVLLVENEGCVILNTTGTYNRSQPPHKTQIAAQGRPWDNCYHDGAGPLAIKLRGILQVDDPDELDRVDQLILDALALGTVVELHSYLTGYTLYDAEIVAWEMPHEIGRVSNLDFQLVVRSRREPDNE
jgi:hypothetical protein